jgi:predicted HicB family RNase H-like nuclease
MGRGIHLPTSKAQIEATARYSKKAYDKLSVYIPKGDNEKLKAFVQANGESVNGFIVRLIMEELESSQPTLPKKKPKLTPID